MKLRFQELSRAKVLWLKVLKTTTESYISLMDQSPRLTTEEESGEQQTSMELLESAI